MKSERKLLCALVLSDGQLALGGHMAHNNLLQQSQEAQAKYRLTRDKKDG